MQNPSQTDFSKLSSLFPGCKEGFHPEIHPAEENSDMSQQNSDPRKNFTELQIPKLAAHNLCDTESVSMDCALGGLSRKSRDISQTPILTLSVVILTPLTVFMEQWTPTIFDAHSK